MRIERISFSSAGTGTKKTTKNPSNQENTSQNISHNNNSKYIIGGLVGVAALTGIVITGRKGYLGTKIQKLFGNGEKNIKNTTNRIKTQVLPAYSLNKYSSNLLRINKMNMYYAFLYFPSDIWKLC